MRDRRKRISYFTGQILILLFIITILFLFLFIIGNFQEFNDETQIRLIEWMRLCSLFYLWLGAVHLALSLLELILFRAFRPGFAVFLIFSWAVILVIRVVLTAAGKIIL